MTTPELSPSLVVGVLVGGRGRRMGGVAKGLLCAPGSTQSLLERLLNELSQALPSCPVRLIGAAEAYAELGVPSHPDEPPGIGPLGGLASLITQAAREGHADVLALACDLPGITSELLERLASHAPGASAVVALQRGVRNPLIARYRTTPTLHATQRALVAGKRSLQAVLDELAPDVHALPMSESEAALLEDWDTPEDVERLATTTRGRTR